MTKKEFDSTKWNKGMVCLYNVLSLTEARVVKIISVDFKERIIEIKLNKIDTICARHWEIELIKKETKDDIND